MKKVFRIFKRILVIVFALIFLLGVAIFTYHHYQLSRESELIKSKGTVVAINNKNINIYEEGEGEETFVFMAGSGIAAPVYEMKGLYSRFSKRNKVAVVERAGYGYSDVFGDKRDIDSILQQTRKALAESGNKPPYILVPHSISGIEAIYWAQKYPGEIKGIIGLDIGLPEEYVEHKINLADSVMVRGMNVLTRIGVHRLFPSATYDPEVIDQSFLSENEKEIFKAISFRKAFNEDMKNEILQMYHNAKKSTELPIPKATPILFLSAYTDQNKSSKFTIRKNKSYEAFAEQLTLSEVKKINGKHSIYLYAPDEIHQLTMEFIKAKGQEGIVEKRTIKNDEPQGSEQGSKKDKEVNVNLIDQTEKDENISLEQKTIKKNDVLLTKFKGTVSKVETLKAPDVISEEKWIEAKENFHYHNEIVDHLNLSDFEPNEAYNGILNDTEFQIRLFRNDEFLVFVSKFGNKEKVELVQDFYSTPWLFYGENIRFQQFAKGVGLTYNISTSTFKEAQSLNDYELQTFDNIFYETIINKKKSSLGIGDEVEIGGNKLRYIDKNTLIIQ